MMPLNTLVLFIFFAFVPFLSEAQRFNITGRVSDIHTTQPVSQISVFDRISGTGTITTEQGNYSLLLNQGHVELLVSGIQYEPFLISFELKRDTLIDIRLTQLYDQKNKRMRRDGGIALTGPSRVKEHSER